MSEVQVLATGRKFIGKGVRGTEPVVEELIQKARHEIQIAAYVFTQSAGKLIDLLEKAAERGIPITLVVNNLEGQREPIRGRLKNLASHGRHVRVVDFIDTERGQLHAKVVIVDRKKAVIGSANFTRGGMSMNYEIGVLLQGEKVSVLAELIDTLAEQSEKEISTV